MTKQSIEQAISSFYGGLYSEENGEIPDSDPFMEELARGTSASMADLDRRIESSSQNWRLDRMAPVDRNILRVAAFEMLKRSTPAPIVIDEALELARQFSGEESVGFINGVLDAIHKGLRI